MEPNRKTSQESTRAPGGFISLVCGGAGFVGSHLCDRLLEEGHRVISLDNCSTGRAKNVEHLLSNVRFDSVDHDLSRSVDLRSLRTSKGGSVGEIIEQGDSTLHVWHLASPASPVDYLARPIETLQVGSLGTSQALEWARAAGGRFLLASTSEVYGDPQVSPQPESYWGNVNPVGPRSVYDEAKRYAEALTMAYFRAHGLPVRIARIFNTYGERMRHDDGRALPNFMMQALQDKPLTVYGDGSQTRSFCYVSDLIEGLVRLMESEISDPINIGNPDEIPVSKLAGEIIELTGSSSAIVYEPLPQDDPLRRRPDITRAKELLGWTPQISRRSGLKRVVEYFRAEVEALCAR